MGLLCLDDTKHDSLRVSHSHTDILTSAPARFNYTTRIQVTGFPEFICIKADRSHTRN